MKAISKRLYRLKFKNQAITMQVEHSAINKYSGKFLVRWSIWTIQKVRRFRDGPM